ncbi:MAG TPA: methyltransferase domain-containing protein [Pseudonocardiaceae bacterium]|nr:methyltransferase domain-containing protein [Pseudonocardiaceae bacterium]
MWGKGRTPVDESVYTPPREVTSVDDCYFYHTMDIPGHGVVTGEWDLRGRENLYLGGFDFTGKRVLELGPASGFLTRYMEQAGAEVVAYDLSEDHSWDTVPFDGSDFAQLDSERREHIRRLNNGWWLNRSANNLSARAVYGTVYTVPEAIGPVDVATFASILLHVRDPFLAVQTAARLVRETIIITDIYPTTDFHLVPDQLSSADPAIVTELPKESFGEPKTVFMPQYWDKAYVDTWWLLSPTAVLRYLGVLGFTETKVTYHFAPSRGNPRTMLYTVVANRAEPVED